MLQPGVRRVKAVALAGLVVGVMAVAAPLASADSCVPELTTARCGSIVAPLDRDRPEIGTVTVAYAVVPRSDESRPSLGAVVPNPGGPSLNAIARGGDYAAKLAPLLERRELLLIDPRGTGRSDALACSALDGPLGSAAAARIAVGACGRELGVRGGLYGTAAVADDIEQIRVKLGMERLDLWGESYGTYLMQVYAARHPAHVGAVVLSGAYPIDFDPWGRDRAEASRRGVQLVCARTDACQGDVVLRELGRLAARLRLHPIDLELPSGPARLDEGALAELLYLGFFDRLPAVTASALAGDEAPLRALFSFVRLMLTAPQPPAEGDVDSVALRYAVMCHDYPRAYSYADTPVARRASYARALAALDSRPFWPFSPAGWTGADFEGLDSCIEWPEDPTAALPIDPRSVLPDVPALVIAGDLDTNTPSSGGREVARRFARGVFMEVSNAGHYPTATSACAVQAGMNFIDAGDADPQACVSDGAPPAVVARAPLWAAGLPPVLSAGSARERRAVAVLRATASALLEQLPVLQAWGAVDGLRGGRFTRSGDGTLRLAGVRLVRDAHVSGSMTASDGGLAGDWRVSGAGVAPGRVHVVLPAAGGGRLTGSIGRQRVDVRLD